MVHEEPENISPRSTILAKKDSNSSNDTFDINIAINRLVNAVEYGVLTSYKPQDRAQMFGEQFACFLRNLDEVQFYDATIYISKYMKMMTEKQVDDKLDN